MKPPTRTGLVFLTLFALPWAAISVAGVVQAVNYARAGNLHDAIFEAIAVILCGCMGFGILTAVFAKWKVAAQAARGRAKHPNEPWLWRPDWAAGRVEDSTHSKMVLLWMFAVCWNAVSLPILFLVLDEVIVKKNFPILLALLFPCIGFGLVVWARKATARWRKFGKSVFVMSNVPGVIGGALAGSIEFQKPLQTDVEFQLQLSCIQRKTRAGGVSMKSNNRSSMVETELWQEEKTVQMDARGTIPVEFLVPAKARAADIQKGSNQIIWRLDVDAPVAGLSYSASFDVPVFKV
jgi:hypothetical protein